MSKCSLANFTCRILELTAVGITVSITTAWLNHSWIMPKIEENKQRSEMIENFLSQALDKKDLSSSIDMAIKNKITPAEFTNEYLNKSTQDGTTKN